MKLLKKRQPDPAPRRPVTGLGRTTAFSYYSHRSTEQMALGRQLFRDTITSQAAKRAGKYSLQRFGLLLVLIVAGVSAVSILSLSTDATVVPLNADQNGFLHSTAVYQRSADQLLAGSLLNRNKITVDADGVSRALQREYPELETVSIELPLIGHRPLVYIAAAKAELALTTTGGTSYIIDRHGRAIGNLGHGTAEALRLTSIRDDSGSPVRLGVAVLPSDMVDFIHTVLYQLGQKQLSASTLVLPAGKSELDVYLQGYHYFVKFNLQSGSAVQQAGTFLAVKHNLEGRGFTPAQYIDVRIDGRAYYK